MVHFLLKIHKTPISISLFSIASSNGVERKMPWGHDARVNYLKSFAIISENILGSSYIYVMFKKIVGQPGTKKVNIYILFYQLADEIL